jgi:hypothetical protein
MKTNGTREIPKLHKRKKKKEKREEHDREGVRKVSMKGEVSSLKQGRIEECAAIYDELENSSEGNVRDLIKVLSQSLSEGTEENT